MRTGLIAVLIVTGVLFAASVVVFHFNLGLSWADSIYFVVATITTVGYGDFNLQTAPLGVKLFGSFVMIAGAAAMAATFGIITDFLLRARLAELLVPRRRHMRNHIILCGLGNVGFRVFEYLRKMGEEVVVVEKESAGSFLDEARSQKVPLVLGDIRFGSTLDEANVQEAKCLIAATDDDLANLDAALTAREQNKSIRVVLRMFDQGLAKKVRDAFSIETAFSTSALAAPAVAMAAIDSSVVGSYYVGDDLMLNVELDVRKGTKLDGLTAEKLCDQGTVRMLAHTSGATGKRQLHPSAQQPIRAGDRLVLSISQDFLARLQELNARA